MEVKIPDVPIRVVLYGKYGKDWGSFPLNAEIALPPDVVKPPRVLNIQGRIFTFDRRVQFVFRPDLIVYQEQAVYDLCLDKCAVFDTDVYPSALDTGEFHVECDTGDGVWYPYCSADDKPRRYATAVEALAAMPRMKGHWRIVDQHGNVICTRDSY